MRDVVSAQLAIAEPRRIKATHRRRRKVAVGHFVQRYYDPGIGRFLSVDPMASDMNNGWNFNRYNYAANNPYRFTDPDGRSIWTKLFKLVKSGGNVAQVTAGVVSDFKTIADPSASTSSKVLAGASMISEALPLSIGDGAAILKNFKGGSKGASGELTTVSGGKYPGNSTGSSATGGDPRAPMNPRTQEALDNVQKPSRTHGECCEIDAINKSLNAGDDVRGAKMGPVTLHESGREIPACSTCREVKKELGID